MPEPDRRRPCHTKDWAQGPLSSGLQCAVQEVVGPCTWVVDELRENDTPVNDEPERACADGSDLVGPRAVYDVENRWVAHGDGPCEFLTDVSEGGGHVVAHGSWGEPPRFRRDPFGASADVPAHSSVGRAQ